MTNEKCIHCGSVEDSELKCEHCNTYRDESMTNENKEKPKGYEAKYCPICGAEADVFTEFDQPRVGCSDESCIMVFGDYGVDLKAWNTRPSASEGGDVELRKIVKESIAATAYKPRVAPSFILEERFEMLESMIVGMIVNTRLLHKTQSDPRLKEAVGIVTNLEKLLSKHIKLSVFNTVPAQIHVNTVSRELTKIKTTLEK